MSARYTIDELRKIVAPLAKKYGAERIYLFGSYARGDETEHRDIDLRIDKGRIRGLALAGLLVDLEDALGLSVDMLTTASLDERFLSAIRNDEVLLYTCFPGAPIDYLHVGLPVGNDEVFSYMGTK